MSLYKKVESVELLSDELVSGYGKIPHDIFIVACIDASVRAIKATAGLSNVQALQVIKETVNMMLLKENQQ